MNHTRLSVILAFLHFVLLGIFIGSIICAALVQQWPLLLIMTAAGVLVARDAKHSRDQLYVWLDKKE